MKWCLQSPFLLLHSAAIDLQEVKDSIDEEDQGLQALHGAPLLGSVQDAFVCKEVKALLGRKVSSGRKTLKDFQDLEERVKSLKALKDSEEQCKEMFKQKLLLQKECTLANDELDKLKMKNSDLWTKCLH